ncbi:hypothetical protein Tco_0036542, partial [Tanacetum coccineum]
REWLPCAASTSKNALYSIAYNNEASTPTTQNSRAFLILKHNKGIDGHSTSVEEEYSPSEALSAEQTLSHREDRVITRSHTQGVASPVVVSDDQSTSDYSPRSSEVLSAEETLGHRDDRVENRSQTQGTACFHAILLIYAMLMTRLTAKEYNIEPWVGQYFFYLVLALRELRSNEENSPMSTGHHSQPQEKQHLVCDYE